ncbi:uncharacterized protein LOC126820247 [Patella vulgata]|uniref:uncharacterized protein LOC126820247 n=1 Tax=Patella vulgata TaxID=6465 RepID=UPI00217FAEB4|nr:uncharacterized protein LOC126820247 [Patella vulgata]
MSKPDHFVGFQPLLRPIKETDEKSRSHSLTSPADTGDRSTAALTEQINSTASTKTVDIESYITRLKQNMETLEITNKQLRDEVKSQLRYSEDLREKYEECFELNVVLKEEINKQVQNVRSWRVKAVTNGCDAAIYRQENEELRETMVMIQRDMLQPHPCYCVPSTPESKNKFALGEEKKLLDPVTQCPESMSTQALIKRFLENFCPDNRASVDMQVSNNPSHSRTSPVEEQDTMSTELETIPDNIDLHLQCKPKENGEDEEYYKETKDISDQETDDEPCFSNKNVQDSELDDSGYVEACEAEQESGDIQEISTVDCHIKPDEKESDDGKNANDDRNVSMKREDENESNFEITAVVSNLRPMEQIPSKSKMISPVVTRGLKIRRFDQQTPGFELEGRIVPEDRRQSHKSSLNDPPNILRPLMPRGPGIKKVVSNIRAPTEVKSSDSIPSLFDPNNRILPQIRSRSDFVKTSTTPVLKGLRTSLVQFQNINFPSIYTRVDVSATLKSPEKAPRKFSSVPPSSQKPAHRRSLLNDRQQLPRIVDFK